MARPVGSIRFFGITLPGNWAPVVGSVITKRLPLFWRVWEKSPLRSSSVGVYLLWAPPGTNWPVYSWDQKKKSFFLSVLNTFGMKIGPPMLYVSTLKRYLLRGETSWPSAFRPLRLLVHELAFQPSWRWFQAAVPWNCWVPLLVTTVMVPPALRPNSAW